MFCVQRGEKFAAIALWGSGAWRNLSDPIDLGDGVGATWSPPVRVSEFWLQTLGTIKAREIERTNLWLICKRPSEAPHELTNEDEKLSKQVNDLFYSLILASPLPFEKGFHLRGINLSGEPEVRGYGEVPKHYLSEDLRPSVGPNEIRAAKRIMDSGWRSLVYRQPDPMRIAFAFSAYVRGLQEEHFDTRLHQFVRTLEGIVRSHNASQFVSRCQLFAGGRIEVKDFLRECYKLRNKIEHMSHYGEALPGLSWEDQAKRLAHDMYVLSKLCRYVLARLASEPMVRALFDDNVIDEFWKRPNEERVRLWGHPLDLGDVTLRLS